MKKTRSKKIPFALHLLRFIYNTAGRIFPVYFSSRAYEQWFTTIRFKTPAFEVHALESACHESIIVNGIPVAVYVWQNKTITQDKTLLFIHGWTGRGSQVAYYIKRLNAIGYRVISFDGIAHGKTPGTQTSAFEMADIVLTLNKHYGKFDAAITHSFGGMVLIYVMTLGLKFDCAALICPPNNFQVLLDNFQRILALPKNITQRLARKSYATHGQILRDSLNTANNVKNINCKGLVLHDENDADISWHSGEEIAKNWPGAQFIKTKNLGHRTIIRDETVINNIIDFIKGAS
ncbi:hypothetical protein MNBD_GAMMA06-1505 [hydrothermal vent metagenome]|uniref:AB hydrolase-1 domain-containing protein n=1 Tax=hydrothermal vent metagenome TaxID=652676 RepID=A0A3B0WH77_9ZZZZ